MQNLSKSLAIASLTCFVPLRLETEFAMQRKWKSPKATQKAFFAILRHVLIMEIRCFLRYIANWYQKMHHFWPQMANHWEKEYSRVPCVCYKDFWPLSGISNSVWMYKQMRMIIYMHMYETYKSICNTPLPDYVLSCVFRFFGRIFDLLLVFVLY